MIISVHPYNGSIHLEDIENGNTQPNRLYIEWYPTAWLMFIMPESWSLRHRSRWRCERT